MATVTRKGPVTFWLGVHHPNWLSQAAGLFVSHRTLRSLRRLPRARGHWTLDSGGFTELSLTGDWQTSPREYVTAVRRYRRDVGHLAWAAPQDWMCEAVMLQRTGLTVAEHQQRTVANYRELRDLAPELPIIPVLQGWTLDDYLRCVEMYDQAAIDLTTVGLVGLGSICRRQATGEIAAVVSRLAGLGLRLHGFGVKVSGLARYAAGLASADSMAWSLYARHERRPLDSCTHASCANCLRYALRWRATVVRRLDRISLGATGLACEACGACGTPLTQPERPARGRPARFCSTACRVAAQLRRARGLPEATPRVIPGGRSQLDARFYGPGLPGVKYLA